MRGTSTTIATALLAVLLTIAPAGCGKKQPVAIPLPAKAPVYVPPPPQTSPVIVLPIPAPPEAPPAEPAPPVHYSEGERRFEAGEYDAACRHYETFLREEPFAPSRDRALFRLGLSYALSYAHSQSRRRSADQFRELVRLHPQSPYRAPAEMILRLQEEIAGLQGESERMRKDAKAAEEKIKNLNEELERLKQIDMTRKPTKPPR